MNTEDAILRAIWDEPAEDTPRLALADFLEQYAGTVPCWPCHGTGTVGPAPGCPAGQCPACKGGGSVPDGSAARAEFIRVQCRLAVLESDPRQAQCSAPEWDEFLARERALLELHWHPWSFPAATYCVNPHGPAVPYPGAVGVTFSRGFVSEVRLSLASFFGGPCGQCGGRGEYPTPTRGNPLFGSMTVVCTACFGAGRLPGLAAKLGRVVGLTAIILIGREPIDGTAWVRSTGTPRRRSPLRPPPRHTPEQMERATIPGEIFDLLPGVEPHMNWRDFKDAELVLSAAALAHSRTLASPAPAAPPAAGAAG